MRFDPKGPAGHAVVTCHPPSARVEERTTRRRRPMRIPRHIAEATWSRPQMRLVGTHTNPPGLSALSSRAPAVSLDHKPPATAKNPNTPFVNLWPAGSRRESPFVAQRGPHFPVGSQILGEEFLLTHLTSQRVCCNLQHFSVLVNLVSQKII